MKKTVNRVMSLVMALLLALTCFAFAETDEFGNIAVDPLITNELDMTAEEWLADADSHVLFVTASICDCLNIWTDADVNIITTAIAANTIYIAEQDDLLFINAFAEDAYMVYAYSPELGLAYYSVSESEDAAFVFENHQEAMDAMISQGVYEEYFAVNGEDILDTLTQLAELMGE